MTVKRTVVIPTCYLTAFGYMALQLQAYQALEAITSARGTCGAGYRAMIGPSLCQRAFLPDRLAADGRPQSAEYLLFDKGSAAFMASVGRVPALRLK